MRVGPVGAAGVLLALGLAGCSGPLGPKYEYEEQLYLRVDGAATIVVDASLPSLVALRGLPIAPDPKTRVDREAIRRVFETAGCPGVRVGQPWVRQGRHFIQVRMSADDVRKFAACGPLAWSTYQFEKADEVIHYQQRVGASAVAPLAKVNWNGSEIVGFKLHLPSKILFHNVKRLKDGSNGEVDRGNILTYEQLLSDRRAGKPLAIDVRMGAQSILFQTLWLFGGAFAAALALMATLIWLTVRRGRSQRPLG
jgi:hypothetical protein